jgi:hypothetical protein
VELPAGETSPPTLQVVSSCEAAGRGAVVLGRNKEAYLADETTAQDTLKQNWSKYMVNGKNFRLADEVRYILGRAAEHDGRVITIGQIILFSTGTGDAWLLDPSDQLAAQLARDGDPEPFHIEE